MLIEEIQAQVAASSAAMRDVRNELAKVVVGQEAIIQRLLIAILADGHVLIEHSGKRSCRRRCRPS